MSPRDSSYKTHYYVYSYKETVLLLLPFFAATINFFTLFWSFLPGETSRELDASTQSGCTALIAPLTFFSFKPPDKNIGRVMPSMCLTSSQLNFFPVPPMRDRLKVSKRKAKTLYFKILFRLDLSFTLNALIIFLSLNLRQNSGDSEP